MKRKLCAALALFAALIGLFNVPAWAAGVLASGECGATGNDVTWTLYKDGSLIIEGAGDMRDYAGADSSPWYAYREQVLKAEIQKGVTSVGDNVFRNCVNLESVTLPDGLTRIGSVAFYQCSKLVEVTLPESLEKIGENAFGYCALKEIAIPAKVSEIGDSAFFKCVELTKIEVNAANETYSSSGDGVLFDKVAPPEPQEGEEAAAPGKSLLIWYPAAKTEAEYAVPEGITKISPYAFHSAANLKKVTLPAGVTEIGEWAFSYNTVLTNIELPKSLTTVGDYAFYSCTALSSDDGKSNTPDSGVLFGGNRQDWSALVMGTGNYRLTNANINFNETKQDNVIASGECGALGSNASWSLSKEGELLISGAGEMVNYRNAASVPWASYRTADGNDEKVAILTVTIEGSATEVINDKGEVETVKKGITNIGDYAFYDCAELTAASLPPTLETIGTYAFADCAKLADINQLEGMNKLYEKSVITIGDYAFSGCAALTNLEFPETLETIGKRAFLRSGLTDVTIPLGVSDIGEWAFRWCAQLESLTMETLKEDDETHYVAIGDYAFADCSALKSAVFTENLTVIGEYAFSKCAALTAVAIPASVSGIGSCAFYACPALTGVVVNPENQSYSSVIVMTDEAGEVSEDESGMIMNKDQTCIFFYPIARPSPSCAIPETVTSVAAFAFDGATSLTDVFYKGTQTQWDNRVAPNIGLYNDPLLKATLTCEGVDPDDSADEISILTFEVDETEDARIATISVHCGENTAGGAQILCATYDEDGRFLGMEAQDILVGTDETYSFELSETAASLRVFVVDGEALPCCPSKDQGL